MVDERDGPENIPENMKDSSEPGWRDFLCDVRPDAVSFQRGPMLSLGRVAPEALLRTPVSMPSQRLIPTEGVFRQGSPR
jgi:hypothetical protein